jgi:hypothetical protein
MNTQNRLGIWISKPEHLVKIDKVISNYSNLDDIFLISDNAISHDKYATIPSYYMSFYDIMVAFIDLEDFVTNQNFIRSNNISLFCSSDEILQSKIDNRFFKNIKVIEL